MASEATGIVEKLENLLKEMKEWERRPVLRVGRIIVELVKMPERKSRSGYEPERLTLHVRLEDAFRGVFIESLEELDDLKTALSSERIMDIMKGLEEMARKRKVQEYEL